MTLANGFVAADFVAGLVAFAAVGHVSSYLKRSQPVWWEQFNDTRPWVRGSMMLRWIGLVWSRAVLSGSDAGLKYRVLIARVALLVFPALVIATICSS